MAVSVVERTTATIASASATVNAPSDIAEGDFWLWQLSVASTPIITDLPTGWTLLSYHGRMFASNQYRPLPVAYKIVTAADVASPPSTVTFTLSGAVNGDIALSAYRSDSGQIAFDFSEPKVLAFGAADTWTLPGFTPRIGGKVIATVTALFASATEQTFTLPSGWSSGLNTGNSQRWCFTFETDGEVAANELISDLVVNPSANWDVDMTTTMMLVLSDQEPINQPVYLPQLFSRIVNQSNINGSIPKPPDMLDNSLAVFVLAAREGYAITWPTGFTQIAYVTPSPAAAGPLVAVATKPIVTASSEPANYAFVWGTQTFYVGWMTTIPGAADANVIVGADLENATPGTDLTVPAVSSTEQNALNLIFADNYNTSPSAKTVDNPDQFGVLDLLAASRTALLVGSRWHNEPGEFDAAQITLGGSDQVAGVQIVIEPSAPIEWEEEEEQPSHTYIEHIFPLLLPS